MSIMKDMEALTAKCDALEKEKGQFEAIATESKEKLTAMSEANAALNKQVEDAKVSLDAYKAEVKANDEVLAAEIAALKKENDELKAKLELLPKEGFVEGRKPIADAGQAGEVRDYVAELNKLSGDEKMKFYRANKKEIDAAYKAR